MPSMQKQTRLLRVRNAESVFMCHVKILVKNNVELGSDIGSWYCKDCKAEHRLCTDDVLDDHKAVQCDKCEMWVHNNYYSSLIFSMKLLYTKYNLYQDLSKMWLF